MCISAIVHTAFGVASMKLLVLVCLLLSCATNAFVATSPRSFCSSRAQASLQQLPHKTLSHASRPKATTRSRLFMQFGNPEGDDGRPTITRDSEPEEYFQTNLDKATTEEKLGDPIVLLAFGWLVGMAAVATIFILKGVE
ncbi:unnamed protein product [Chrysoparadoxa australica]